MTAPPSRPAAGYDIIRAGSGRSEPDVRMPAGPSRAGAERSAREQSAADPAGRAFAVTDRAGRTLAEYRRGERTGGLR